MGKIEFKLLYQGPGRLSEYKIHSLTLVCVCVVSSVSVVDPSWSMLLFSVWGTQFNMLCVFFCRDAILNGRHRNIRNTHTHTHTVDGWNLAPPGMYETLYINDRINYQPQLVQNFSHQQYQSRGFLFPHHWSSSHQLNSLDLHPTSSCKYRFIGNSGIIKLPILRDQTMQILRNFPHIKCLVWGGVI